MNKFSLFSLSAATLLLASCSSETDFPEMENGTPAQVSFTVSTPVEFSTRAINDGASATDLTVVVYDADGNFIYSEDRGTVFSSTERSKNVQVDLITGNSYIVAFWVDAHTGSPYTITNGQLSVSYADALANDDTRDAFYAAKAITVSAGQLAQEVTLTRPFAQVNLGTDDYEFVKTHFGLTPAQSTVTIKGCAYAGMNLANGNVTGEVVDVTFGINDMPDYAAATGPATLSAAGKDYSWIGMNYILCDKAGGTISEISFSTEQGGLGTRTYSAGVPVKRNYRSNLVGSLFTSSTGWNVTLDAGIDDSVHEVGGATVNLNDDGTITCLVPALPEGVTETYLEENNYAGVALDASGNPVYFSNSVNDIKTIFSTAKEIYFAPNAVISDYQAHAFNVSPTGITIHGNGATIDGSECDISIQYTTYTPGSTVNIVINNLNNARVWGDTSTACTLNVTMNNCSFVATPSRYNLGLVMMRGGDGAATHNITLNDCYCEGVQVGVHSTSPGTFIMNNCTFKNVGIPVNLAKKPADKVLNVNINKSIFADCGLDPDGTDSAKDYAAPIRVVDNGGPANATTLKVTDCIISGNKSNWDVLLMDYRDGKTWYPVSYEITGSGNPSVRAEAE